MLSAHVMVLNYNGMAFLPQILPTIVEACRRSRYPAKLSVIDNESTDESVGFIRENYPSVRIFESPNRFLCSYNEVAKRVEEPILIFLNNDLRVREDFIDPLMGPFEKNGDVFLVCPKVFHYDGHRIMGGASRAWFSFGLPKAEDLPEEERAQNVSGPTFLAGCALAIDRKKFLSLGGYDDMYLPGTVEDMDLCFRAWRNGYYCFYEPKSMVYHKGQASFHKKFGSFLTTEVNARNTYLFVWKNITDRRLLFEHLFFIPFRLILNLLRGQLFWVTGFFQALSKRREALLRRRDTLKNRVVRSDREIFSVVP